MSKHINSIDNSNKKVNSVLAEGYAMIPNIILNDKEISANAKILYCKISSLCAIKGYCFASNKYLAEQLGVTPSQIKRLLAQLIDYLFFTDRKSYKRKIYLEKPVEEDVEKQNSPEQKCTSTGAKMRQYRSKNALHNIKNDINKLNNINLLSKKEKKLIFDLDDWFGRCGFSKWNASSLLKKYKFDKLEKAWIRACQDSGSGNGVDVFWEVLKN